MKRQDKLTSFAHAIGVTASSPISISCRNRTYTCTTRSPIDGLCIRGVIRCGNVPRIYAFKIAVASVAYFRIDSYKLRVKVLRAPAETVCGATNNARVVAPKGRVTSTRGNTSTIACSDKCEQCESCRTQGWIACWFTRRSSCWLLLLTNQWRVRCITSFKSI